MKNRNRFHQIFSFPKENITEFAQMLRTATSCWHLCTGFRIGKFLLLNDSNEETEVVSEFAVVLEKEHLHIDSLIISEMSPKQIVERLQSLEAHRQELVRKHLPLNEGWTLQENVSFQQHLQHLCSLCG